MSVAEKQEISACPNLSWPDVRADYRLLDSLTLPLQPFRIITPDVMDNGYERSCPIERVLPGTLARSTRRFSLMAESLFALQTLLAADSRTTIVWKAIYFCAGVMPHAPVPANAQITLRAG